jgi:hypothetical protein
MTNSTGQRGPFTASFVETEGKVLLELMNTTDQPLKSVEFMTIFLKDEEIPGDIPSRAHIKFEDIGSVQPRETVVLSHRTWIDGKPAGPLQDRLERLKIVPGATKSYVLDICWEDAKRKMQYQRIPLGH